MEDTQNVTPEVVPEVVEETPAPEVVEEVPTPEVVEETPAPEIVEDASFTGPIVSPETTPDATLVYKGKKVVSVGTETVNDIVYQRLSLEDATTVLLTEDEYRKEVSVA